MQVPENCEQFKEGEEGDPGLVRQDLQSSWEGLPTGEGQNFCSDLPRISVVEQRA